VLANEVSEYRKFLENQFRLTVWSIGLLVAVAAFAFLYFFGKSKDELRQDLVSERDELRQELIREVNQSIVAYQLEQTLKDRLNLIAKNVAEGETVQNTINQLVNITVEKVAQQKVAEDVKTALSDKLKDLSGENLHQLLQKAIDQTLQAINDRLETLQTELSRRISLSTPYRIKSTATPDQGYALADFNGKTFQLGAVRVGKPESFNPDERLHLATTWTIEPAY
jgi:hypothetical protein